MSQVDSSQTHPALSYDPTGERGAQIWEQALVAIWVAVTFAPFPGDELFLYPLALSFAGSFVLMRKELMPIAIRAWILFLIPALSIASWTWSTVPSEALRFGIMMMLTSLIAIYIGARFNRRNIAVAVFLGAALITITWLPHIIQYGVQWGPWGEKNFFASRMLILLTAASAVAFDRGQSALLRPVAFLFVPFAFYYILVSESATALVLGGGSLVAILSIWFFWVGLAGVRHARTSFVVIALIATTFGALVLFNGPPGESLFDRFLAAVGKDSTLTGRTQLWDAAARVSQEKPWLGTGAKGFWLWDSGDAQSILFQLRRDPDNEFSFHNSYLEAQVHLGYVGLAAMVSVVAWTMYHSVVGWLRGQDVPRTFIFLIALQTFVTSFTESALFYVFQIGVMLFYASAVASITERQRELDAIRREALFRDFIDFEENDLDEAGARGA